MKYWHKLVALSLAMLFYSHAIADGICNTIKGFYTGTYIDTTGLFPSHAFPINAYLNFQNGMIYGYTLSSNDQTGPAYGQAPYALIWATCQNNQISNLYIIKNTVTPCGDPAPGPMPLTSNGPLNVNFNYENAMINANLKATLNQDNSEFANSSAFTQAVNNTLLQAAMTMAQAGIQTCH